MASVNEKLFDEAVSHQIGLQRYSNGIVRRMIALLNRVDPALTAQLIAKIESAPESLSVERIDNLLQSVNKLIAQAYAKVGEQLDDELKGLAEYEVGYQQKLFEHVLPAAVKVQPVQPLQVYAAAMARPFQGKLLSEFMDGLEAGKAEAIRNAVRMGFVEGQTVSEIVKRIRGTKALNYADGLLETNRRGVEAIVRTAINHTGNYARQAFFEANGDIVSEERYTATLDARTTELCASRDGKTYPIGKGPAIPAHLNCRSLYVPVLKSWREMGIPADEMPEGTRASMDGQVPESTTYQSWLSKQSVERQNEVLGVTKAQLFRNGGLTLDRFVNNSGHVYTLDELMRRDAQAFVKAGL